MLLNELLNWRKPSVCCIYPSLGERIFTHLFSFLNHVFWLRSIFFFCHLIFSSLDDSCFLQAAIYFITPVNPSLLILPDKFWYCRLSPNHKVLHYGDLEESPQGEVPHDSLQDKCEYHSNWIDQNVELSNWEPNQFSRFFCKALT